MQSEQVEITTARVTAHGNGQVIISGLTQEETEKLVGSVRGGAFWVRFVEGKAVFSPAFKAVPDPVCDKKMLPFWRQHTEVQTSLQIVSFDEDRIKNGSPSIHITGLCGYAYSKENYQKNAELLESYGFSVMRSRRGNDATYWETWYLPGLWAAKGWLRRSINDPSNDDEVDMLKKAVEFLRNNVSFGSLDVCVQRLAAVLELE